MLALARLAAAAVAAIVAGCANDPSKLGNPGVTTYFTAIAARQNLESDLISAFQQQNRTLQYLSRNNYSCGDPSSSIVRRYSTLKDPKKFAEANFNDGAWKANVKLIRDYSVFITQILDQDKASKDQIDAVSGALAGVAAAFPPTSVYSPAIAPVTKVLQTLRSGITSAKLANLALSMQGPLTKAVAYLENPTVLAEMNASEQQAFTLWDSCARETLWYLRDISDPNFAVEFGPQKSRSSKWRPQLTPPDADSLRKAYLEYLAARQKNSPDTDFKKLLDDILTQNEKLAKAAMDISVKQAFATGQDICGAANAVAKAAGAGAACSIGGS